MGLPPISTIGFGLEIVSSDKRVPNPPASITAFNFTQTIIKNYFRIYRRGQSSLACQALKFVAGYNR